MGEWERGRVEKWENRRVEVGGKDRVVPGFRCECGNVGEGCGLVLRPAGVWSRSLRRRTSPAV